MQAAPETFLFPMVDRDPVPRGLSVGAPFSAMPPTRCIRLVRTVPLKRSLMLAFLAGCIRRHHDDIDVALRHYEVARRPATAAIVRANRGLGPELPMKLVEERAPDGFADIAAVITPQEIAEATEEYRRTAGFSLVSLKRGQSLLNDPY